jgi:hypothetical protein
MLGIDDQTGARRPGAQLLQRDRLVRCYLHP